MSGVFAKLWFSLRRWAMPQPGRQRSQASVTRTPASPKQVYRSETPVARLTRLAQWCLEGRRADAELELHGWRRDADCPTAARVLLASSLAQRGALEQARAILVRPAHLLETDDALLAQTLIAVLVRADLTDAARRVLEQLHTELGHREDVAAWIELLQMPGASRLPAIADSRADQLAVQLIAQPQLIGTLVAAQRLAPDRDAVLLLRQALGRAEPDLAQLGEDTAYETCVALAQLALLEHDHDDARRWAHRGIKLNRLSAELALVLGQVRDDEVLGPPATAVLAAVSSAFPHYPDVKAALIRREYVEGQVQQANLRLRDWLRTEPQNPIAAQLAQELAA